MNEAKVDLKTIYKELHLQSQYSPYADTTYLQLEKKIQNKYILFIVRVFTWKYNVKYMNAWFEIMNNCMPDIGSDKRQSMGFVVYFFLFFI